MVRVARFELTASWSRTMRATNCATPGYEILQFLRRRTVVLYELPSVLSRGESTFFKKPRSQLAAGHWREHVRIELTLEALHPYHRF